MLFACFIIAQIGGDQPTPPVEIKIHYMRPSKALEIIEQSNANSVPPRGVEADDAKGSILVYGNSKTVQEVRDIAKLIDVPRKKLSIKVTVDSEADKESYQVSAKIWNNQKWKTGDGDTGITVAVQPRISEGNNVTMMVICGREGSTSVQEVFRMKMGSSRTITLGSQVSKILRQGSDGQFNLEQKAVPEPKVTITVDKY
jgi:type II secretory pathway component GspD/PulD (secretin)